MYTFTETLICLYYCKGWNIAEVQAVDYDDDEIDLLFQDKPECVYKFPLLPSITSGSLRLKQKLF